MVADRTISPYLLVKSNQIRLNHRMSCSGELRVFPGQEAAIAAKDEASMGEVETNSYWQ